MARTPRLAAVFGAFGVLTAACGDIGSRDRARRRRGHAVDRCSRHGSAIHRLADDGSAGDSCIGDDDGDGSTPSNDRVVGVGGARREDVETATLEVPVDYEDPDGPTFDLFLARRLADDQENKIGSLLVNPGGPGFGGADFALFAEQI